MARSDARSVRRHVSTRDDAREQKTRACYLKIFSHSRANFWACAIWPAFISSAI